MGDRRDTTDITPGARETMQRAPLPENESTYLDELHQYQTLDTPPEGIFNNVTALAAIRELAGPPSILPASLTKPEAPAATRQYM